MTPTLTPALERRFLAKVDQTAGPEGCWLWTGTPSDRGYGFFSIGPRGSAVQHQAHRLAFQWFVGPVPDGHQVDHTCHNADPRCRGGRSCRHRLCVNPAHLEAVTCRENLMRSDITPAARNAAKKLCPNGHEYDYQAPSGRRGCLECRRAAVIRYAAKRRV